MKNSLSFLFLCLIGYANSQESIQTDRPDQTESVAITPKSFLQSEIGFLYEKINDNSSSISHPTILLKYGINENFELRLITEFISEKFQDEKVSGIPPITLGLKAKLLEEQNVIPAISFLGHITANKISTEKFQTKNIAPSFRFLFQHTLTENLNLGYNIGAEWNGETPEATGIYTLSTAYSISEKWGSFLEVYGFLNKYTSPDHRFDGGFTYLFNNDFQADASAGFGLSRISPDYFLSCGISYRFNTKKVN